ncbi:MAG: transcriptional regulator, MarR family [Fibrobacteres bacterium]|nr:transcriptional regulator, MarR family [Fibrobacterota bacterium]
MDNYRCNRYIKNMAKDIQTEIKQRKPFTCREEELFLNILRSSDLLGRRIGEVLKSSELSATQYNVLRILRGAGSEGMACGEIGGRMVTRDPDITRLLDRLEKRGLVTRSREKDDRRVVTARITSTGLDLLKKLDDPVTQMHKAQLGHLEAKQQETLIRLLETAREKLG